MTTATIVFLGVLVIAQALMIWRNQVKVTKLEDQSGPLPPDIQYELLDLVGQARRIMGDLGPRTEIDDCDFLSQYSKDRIQIWMNGYVYLKGKVDDTTSSSV